MTVSFSGINSVANRTIFTNRGPITKKPLSLLTGSNLRVLSETRVSIPTGSFTQSSVGLQLRISGSVGGRNDGTFYISSVLSSTTVELENVNFNLVDVVATSTLIVSLSNDLRRAYNSHVLSSVHGSIDTNHLVTAQVSVDLEDRKSVV